MAIKDDFSVTRATGNIRAIAGTTNYTVLELHRYLQDLADDASSIGDDELDITDPNPSSRSFDTIINLLGDYNIDDATAQRLFGGSITQGAGGTQVRYAGLQIAGSVPQGAPQVIQNNVKLVNFWDAATTYNPDPALGFSHQFLVKTIDAGSLIDGGRIRVSYREYGFQYREGSTTLGVGNGVVGLGNIQADAFNDVPIGTVVGAPFNTVVNDSEGFNQLDVNQDGSNEDYYSLWNPNQTDLSGLYNRIKYLTRDGETATIYGLDGELFRGITHEIDIRATSGIFLEPEGVSWSGGTGQLLAIDSTVAGQKMWIQLLTGVAPADGQTITADFSTGTAIVDMTVTERVIPTDSVIGSYFGSLLGGYGVGVRTTWTTGLLSAADSLTALDNIARNPPLQVNIQVTGLEGDDAFPLEADSVLLGRDAGGNVLETNRYSANGAQGASSTTYVINEVIDPDNPASGFVRIFDAASNSSKPVAYDSFSGSTFMLTTTIGFEVAANADSFVPFLDGAAGGGSQGQEDGSISAQIVFGSPIAVTGSVRNGNSTAVSPIVPFPLSGSIGSGGFSVTAVRTRDF